MLHSEGESKRGGFRVDFDRRLKLEFHGSNVTSDAGFIAYRELDDALGLTQVAGDRMIGPRTGKNRQHGMTSLFRQSTFGRLGGYEDVNDADRRAKARSNRQERVYGSNLAPRSPTVGAEIRSYLGNVG